MQKLSGHSSSPNSAIGTSVSHCLWLSPYYKNIKIKSTIMEFSLSSIPKILCFINVNSDRKKKFQKDK